MEKRDDMNEKVEGVMQSLDGIKRADPGPWFFSRLSQRLGSNPRSPWFYIGAFLSRPSVAISGVMAVLILNLVLLLNQQSEVETASLPLNFSSENEYITASNSSYDYENLVQP
ncbi:MAG: hypothetical protein ABWZ25_09710 [Chitinophagaceae bacterium]